MIVVEIKLHSAITGRETSLGQMVIANDGTGSKRRGNYNVYLGRKGETDNRRIIRSPQRQGRVEGHPRLSTSVWALVAKACRSVGFAGAAKKYDELAQQMEMLTEEVSAEDSESIDAEKESVH